ncbi:MAG: DNA polymerase III subunit delta [Candidatus Rokubacteria bacterium]|nr:DNA polymerase III subunit delta [Candidatus Rokubacteria bacterium]
MTFLRAAARGAPPAVALLHGSEAVLRDDAVAALTAALFPQPEEASFAREVLQGRDAGVEAIVRAALTLPFLAPRRLVIVRGADALPARAGAEVLRSYVMAPNPSTVLLLLAERALEPSHWLVRLLPGESVVALPTPVGRALVGWLESRAKAAGYDLTPDAAALLVELGGDDLTRLVGEVEKAALAGGDQNRRITAVEVRAVVGEQRVRHVFDLTRAIERRDAGAGLAVLQSLLDAGEEPLAVLGMLVRETRTLWQVAGWLRQGRPDAEIARDVRRPPAAVQAVMTRARATSVEAACHLLVRCWEVERHLKLGGLPRAELGLLVAELCSA